MSHLLKSLAGQTVVYGLGTIVPRFLNYLLTPILTYGFAAAQFGINSELFSYISFLNVIFTYGMETTFFNFNSKLDNKQEVYNNSLLCLLISTFIFSFILLIFSSWIADWLTTPNAKYLPTFIVWSILIIASDALAAIPFAKLRAENKALQFSLLKLMNVSITFFLTLFFLKICKNSYENSEATFYATIYNPEIGIGYSFLSLLISNVITLFFLSKQFFQIEFKMNFELVKEMLTYTWPLVILGLAAMVNDTLDKILIKRLMTDKAEAQVAQGIYGACNKIAVLMSIVIQAFRFAAEPYFFSKSKDKDSKQTYSMVMKYFFIFCLLLFLGISLNLDWLKYIVGKEYRIGLGVVPILLIAYLFLGVVYNLSIWYKLSGQTKFGAVISVFGALITLLINILFVPEFSYMACAWATFAAYAGMMVLSYLLGQKYFPIKYNIRAITVYSIFALTLCFISGFLNSIESFGMRLFLNNLMIAIFVFVVYKLEFDNLKKINSNA